MQNKRLLQRQSKGCISRNTQALACVIKAFSPVFRAIGWTLVAVGALTTIPLVLQLLSDDE